MIRQLIWLVLTTTCIVVVWLQPASAQVPAELSGHVTDAATGSAIAQAQVEVIGRAEHTQSETDGSFTLRGLEPRVYTVRVRAIGYAPSTNDIELANGRTTIWDVVLQPMTRLSPVLVHANRDTWATTGLPGAVTFDRRAIETSGRRDVGELLQTVPGVVITQAGGPGTATTISIRGSGANDVLVLVDGARVNSAITGAADLSQLTLANVDRVTVVSGAQSAKYGSGALAGVVVIETHRADGEMSGMLETGSWGEREASLTAGNTRDWGARKVGLSVTGDDRTLQGNFPYLIPTVRGGGTAERVNDDNASRNLATTASVDGENGTLRLRANWQTMERGIPGSIVQPSTTGRETESRFATGLDANLERGPFTWTTDANVARERATFADPSPPFGGTYNDDVDANDLSLTTNGVVALPLGALSVGIEARSLDVTSTMLDTIAPHQQRQLGMWTSMHTMHSFSDGLEVASDLSARLDRDTFVHGSTVSPRASLALSYRKASLSTSIGQGYTPPSLADQFFHEGVLVRPNPDLQPERVRGDLDARAAIHDVRLGVLAVGGDVDVYRANVDGMILWLPDFRFIWSPTNFDVRRSGWDVNGQVALPSAGLNLQGTLNRSDVTYAGSVLTGQVVYRPRITGSLVGGITRAGTRLEITNRYVGERRTVAGYDLNTLDPYWLTDAKLVLPVLRNTLNLDTTVGVDNIFDHPAAMLVDYPFPGRTWTLALRVRRGRSQP